MVRTVVVTLLVAGALGSLAAGARRPRSSRGSRSPLGVAPCAAAAGGGFVWVSEYGAPALLKIDPKTNKVVAKTGIGFGACGLGYGLRLALDQGHELEHAQRRVGQDQRLRGCDQGRRAATDVTTLCGTDDRQLRRRGAHRPEQGLARRFALDSAVGS